jgi:type I restriction enzyme R subunit
VNAASKFTESVVEEAALGWLDRLGYSVLHGPDIAAGEARAERTDPNYRDVVLERRLHQALVRNRSFCGSYRPKYETQPG